MTFLKLLGRCGVDVDSPAELVLARQVGFDEKEITYTGTSVANEDLGCLHRHPEVQVNCEAGNIFGIFAIRLRPFFGSIILGRRYRRVILQLRKLETGFPRNILITSLLGQQRSTS